MSGLIGVAKHERLSEVLRRRLASHKEILIGKRVLVRFLRKKRSKRRIKPCIVSVKAKPDPGDLEHMIKRLLRQISARRRLQHAQSRKISDKLVNIPFQLRRIRIFRGFPAKVGIQKFFLRMCLIEKLPQKHPRLVQFATALKIRDVLSIG